MIRNVIYNSNYYLADRNNDGIHVIDLNTNTETAIITGFVQSYVNGTINNDISGPDRLVVLPDRKEIYVGDGDGSVKVINLTTNTIVSKIVTGGTKRGDELAYDPTTGTIVVTNPAEDIPMLTVISATKRTVLSHISFPNATELEQPASNLADGKFYISVPSIPGTAAAGGEIAIPDITTLTISKVYYVPKCIPAGIVLRTTKPCLHQLLSWPDPHIRLGGQLRDGCHNRHYNRQHQWPRWYRSSHLLVIHKLLLRSCSRESCRCRSLGL
jgi:hypothetical protein